MTTYAESKGAKPFDWNDFLRRAVAGEILTNEEHLDACRLAHDWVTCACGNQCASIPRSNGSGMPEDEELSNLGALFYSLIDDMEWDCAISTLSSIESRSAELLAQMNEGKGVR